MDTNVLRLKGRLTLIFFFFARADTFGLINEKKTHESKKSPEPPVGGGTVSWRSLTRVGFGCVKGVFMLVRRCCVMS